MAANPQSFFRFAARYYPLLLDLFYRREGFTEADLRNLIEGARSDEDPAPATVIDQLQSFNIIEPIPVWRIEGTFSDTSLESFLHGIKGYTPGIAPPLAESPETARPECILPSELYVRLSAALPVEDLLAWLLENYPQAGVGELVRAYGRIFLRVPETMYSSNEELRYCLPEATLSARPIRLEKFV